MEKSDKKSALNLAILMGVPKKGEKKMGNDTEPCPVCGKMHDASMSHDDEDEDEEKPEMAVDDRIDGESSNKAALKDLFNAVVRLL